MPPLAYPYDFSDNKEKLSTIISAKINTLIYHSILKPIPLQSVSIIYVNSSESLEDTSDISILSLFIYEYRNTSSKSS